MRRDAEALLGTRFNAKDFHTFILDMGLHRLLLYVPTLTAG